MEESKYYTPLISEFHVGFEYEFINGTKWEEDEITYKDLITETSGGDACENWFEEIYKKLRTVRVKYLDKEDIESLGWSDISDRPNYANYGDNFKRYHKSIKSYTGRYSEFGLKCDILYNDITHELNIIAGMFNSYEGNFKFRGIIKNKSELFKLMKQLQIS